LLTQVLRNEWHYTGIVMSDWFGSHATAPSVNACLDI
jgi:beta-glucosidase